MTLDDYNVLKDKVAKEFNWDSWNDMIGKTIIAPNMVKSELIEAIENKLIEEKDAE